MTFVEFLDKHWSDIRWGLLGLIIVLGLYLPWRGK